MIYLSQKLIKRLDRIENTQKGILKILQEVTTILGALQATITLESFDRLSDETKCIVSNGMEKKRAEVEMMLVSHFVKAMNRRERLLD